MKLLAANKAFMLRLIQSLLLLILFLLPFIGMFEPNMSVQVLKLGEGWFCTMFALEFVFLLCTRGSFLYLADSLRVFYNIFFYSNFALFEVRLWLCTFGTFLDVSNIKVCFALSGPFWKSCKNFWKFRKSVFSDRLTLVRGRFGSLLSGELGGCVGSSCSGHQAKCRFWKRLG